MCGKRGANNEVGRRAGVNDSWSDGAMRVTSSNELTICRSSSLGTMRYSVSRTIFRSLAEVRIGAFGL